MSTQSYQTIVKASAIYDLVMTAAFAIPILAAIKIHLLRDFHLYLNLPGEFPIFEPVHLFFVNLTGSVVVIWSVLRIKHPLPILGFYDSLTRFLFSLAMVYALTVGQSSYLLLFFLLPELIWGIIQLKLYYQLKSKEIMSQPFSTLTQ